MTMTPLNPTPASLNPGAGVLIEQGQCPWLAPRPSGGRVRKSNIFWEISPKKNFGEGVTQRHATRLPTAEDSAATIRADQEMERLIVDVDADAAG